MFLAPKNSLKDLISNYLKVNLVYGQKNLNCRIILFLRNKKPIRTIDLTQNTKRNIIQKVPFEMKFYYKFSRLSESMNR